MPDTASARRDSVGRTLLVAVGVSLLCSVLVAGTAISLKPVQVRNEEQYRTGIIRNVAGLDPAGSQASENAARIEVRMVELASGDYVSFADPASFDAQDAANDPESSVSIPAEADLAGLKRRALLSPVYLVQRSGRTDQVILPVFGSGLWSKMYGYLALSADGQTVRGLRFYEHGETPGLGDKIEDPQWLEQWVGKKLFDAEGRPRIEVVRGKVDPNGGRIAADYQIDGLSGATLTGNGVTRLVQYWTGPHGFGPYLKQLDRTVKAQ